MSTRPRLTTVTVTVSVLGHCCIAHHGNRAYSNACHPLCGPHSSLLNRVRQNACVKSKRNDPLAMILLRNN